MRVLVDTHAFLWWCLNDARLSEAARNLMVSKDTEVFLSAASGWEIAIKAGAGRLHLPQDAQIFVPNRLEHWNFGTLPITLHHALLAGELPLHHRYPFDRILVAQSIIENLPIITTDAAVRQYSVEVIW